MFGVFACLLIYLFCFGFFVWNLMIFQGIMLSESKDNQLYPFQFGFFLFLLFPPLLSLFLFLLLLLLFFSFLCLILRVIIAHTYCLSHYYVVVKSLHDQGNL